MAFLVSPGVNTSEIDLTTAVPAVGTSTGATVGHFRWGPANTVVQISSESDLAQVYFAPDSDATAVSFLSAANFLAYGNDLRVIRALATGANNATSNSSHYVSIANDEDYFGDEYNSSNTHVAFSARYPGVVGNSLKISVCDTTANFAGWAYRGLFDAAPNTSNYAYTVTNQRKANDELHIVVVDEDGLISGTANTVLERYSNLSKASDAKGDSGESIYYKEVLYRNSKYIHWMGHPSANAAVADGNVWGVSIATANARAGNAFYSRANVDATTYSLTNASDGTLAAASYTNGLDLLANNSYVDISLLFAGDCGHTAGLSDGDQRTVANKFLQTASDRKDSVAFVSPAYANVVGTSASASAIVSYRNALTQASSYGVMDSGWKYQYDKYTDKYRWVPLNPDVAGLCVRTDQQRDPWFSPAGLSRGQIRNLVKLAFNPTQGDRDTLYKGDVNPVVSFPGEGTVLFGDKTLQGRPSAFDRINVRRLFIVLEKAISRAARSSLFEFNDEFTRAQFIALVEPFLRDVQGRRGIYDFRVVCDETNNTPAVVDRNEFIGDIYIKPARSVNFVQLNFVAVRSGVAFEEIVGRF